MPAYNRVVLSGTLASGAEEFSVGMNFAPDLGAGISSPAELNSWAIAIANDLGTATADSIDRGLSLTGSVTQVSTYWYPDVGAPATAVGTASALYSGSVAAIHPLQTSVVVSLRTAFAGRRYRGRFYWPALGWTVGATGKFTGTPVSAAADDFAEMLEFIAGADGTSVELRPVVVSKAGGFVTPVTSVSVGDVPDTQRRRRDGLTEIYVNSPYPPA